jgi:hypothetical protein
MGEAFSSRYLPASILNRLVCELDFPLLQVSAKAGANSSADLLVLY